MHFTKTRMAILLFLLPSCILHKQKTAIYVGQNANIMSTLTADTIDKLPMLQNYRAKMEQEMNVLVGYTDVELRKEKPNGTLGNMVADAMWQAAYNTNPKVSAAVANYGGLRVPYISVGTITLGKIFELMPFDNNLCTMELSGVLIDTLFNHMARGGGWPISNCSFSIQQNKAVDITIKNTPLKHDSIYVFALNDYMANGGDNCSFLKPLPHIQTGVLVRDAILEYVRDAKAKNKALTQEPFNRIK